MQRQHYFMTHTVMIIATVDLKVLKMITRVLRQKKISHIQHYFMTHIVKVSTVRRKRNAQHRTSEKRQAWTGYMQRPVSKNAAGSERMCFLVFF